MKKLSTAQAARLKIKPPGRISMLRMELLKMEKGEFLLIEPEDWKPKSYSPAYVCRRIEKKNHHRFKVDKVMNGEGWLVKREK